ncbi:MAG: AMP-binding protein, partial [Deltaproteobacteria bacterium]|nr:AMP-binding protein [Deltaproteobacteria bacterium]
SIIGKAIADLNIRLLNQYRQLVPIAVPGEIHVGGGGVARGYLRREALTAERFIADPFSTDPQAKLYRSGDLARWLPNGDLEYLGRIDQQVKIRGFRIELGEIEAVLQQQCEVKEAAVIARQDKPGDKRLVGYFVADRDIGSEELRDRLRAHLPEHMIPAAFVRLERLPLTANGKLDRQALPPPDPLRTELCQDYRPPRSEDEATLCEIWRTVLGVSRVGIDDNFFELGGDSILSIQVISKARQAGLKLATRDLFKRPTIAALAVTAESTATVTAEHMHASGAVLLTLIQHWFVEQELAEQHHWNQAFFFETPADIDVEILEAALQQVVAQHDSLRLRFEKNASGWEQNYSTHVDRVAIHRKDLRSLSSIAQETALTQLAESLQTSLDISAGPIVCAAHIRPGHECAGRLLVIVHHLVIDGVSWHILMEDWETAYLALRANQQPTFPGRTSSYQKWSASLRDYAQSEVVAAEVDYWRSVASRATAELPIDHTTAASSGDSATKTVTMRLSADDTRRLLQAAPRSLRAPINEILLGALATAFAGWIASDSLLVDLEGHGRDELVADADVSRTIGWFTAISPVRLELPAAGALAESLRRAKRLLRAQPRHG